jgi:type I restriction enzyme S subunit
MRSEWREVPLRELALINRDNYSTNDDWSYVYYLDTSNVTKGAIDDIKYLDLGYDKLPSRARRKVERNDIVYSMVRPDQEHYGIIKKPLSNMLVSTGFVTITAKGRINAPYLYYFISQPQITSYLQAIAEQRVSTYPALNVTDISNLKVIVPPLPTQKAIAATLSCLDAKIEVNNKIIKNLEQQAQAIFKSWFVDFEPFQDGEFVESELGLIPKGWRAGSLGEIIKITSGKRPKARQERKDSLFRYPLFGASGIMGYTSAYLYNEKIITIGRVGTHGKVQEISEASWPSDNTLVIMPKHYGFVASVLKAIDYGALNRGSTQPLITQTDIKNTKIVVPATEILGKFEDMYKMYFNLSRTINTQNTTLSALRDTLLPKLMSGEIEVPVEQS